MCDYSLERVASRPAVAADRLVSTNFTGTSHAASLAPAVSTRPCVYDLAPKSRSTPSRAPDLTIVDLNLGGEMAFALLDFLSKRAIPFVVLSGHSPQMVPAQHRDRPFLQKPCQPEALLSKVRGTLSEPRSGALCA